METGLVIPAAVTPTMITAPSKSSGRFTALAVRLVWLQSIHTCPEDSVAIGPNWGMRNLSTPNSFNLIWKLGSPANTLRVSNARLGYSTPFTATTIGSLLVTPSTSGMVLTIPTPAACSSNSGILAIIPG